MRKSSFIAVIVSGSLLTSFACAETFSTSALNPSPVPANGVISGGYPQGGTETTYYFAADLKAGELATQISFMGRPGRDKSLEITLVDPSGKRSGSHYVTGSIDANQEQVRVLPVDSTGRHVIRVTTKGPETTTFRIELGGTALANVEKAASADTPFSRSFLSPTPVPAEGTVAGKFPMSEDGVTTHYYFSANLKAGKLLSQLSFAGRKITDRMVDKMVEFTVLSAKGRAVGSYYIMSGLEANQEATKAIPIDATGAYVLRISVKGPETTGFKLELGGDALAAR
jgi:hypothetical protein